MPPALGLAPPSPDVVASGAAPSPGAKVYSLGGILPMGNVQAALGAPAPVDVERQQAQPVILGLAGLVKSTFSDARAARLAVEQDMLEALYARRGEYTPEQRAKITEARQPLIYMMLASGKMRQIESLLRDVLLGSGTDKPWTLRPTPDPELPPSAVQAAVGQLVAELQQAMMSGFAPTMQAAQERLRQIRDEMLPMVLEEARKRCERMETKMEDQLVEGFFVAALDHLITDIATFKTAFMAGPVMRMKPRLKWGPDGELSVTNEIQLEWERLDPFDVYPAAWARNIQDGPLVIKHRLSRSALNDLIGVEGYSSDAIRRVLELFGDKGLREWLSVDSQRDVAEGRVTGQTTNSQLIDALQFFGSASGRMLLDWGMDPAKVPDAAKEYQVEAWVIGPYVIKAVLNADPLARRPVYAVSFQNVPGTVWGNAPYDLMKDCQAMCNGSARALAANMAISSGPQVAVITNRIPSGEELTEMYPWKLWQFESDPTGSTAKPIEFFQPTSNANELMGVYEKFSLLADEYTGIPRYMAGFNGGEGGAGRTASGISMMITNASKVIKQVLGGIDTHVIGPVLERLYYYNMRYGTDPDLKGDVRIVARGAATLVAKEAAQQRSNEFLQVVLASQAVQQIVGVEGLAELLRPIVRRLDLNPDRVVPPLQVLRQRQAEAMMAQAAMMAAGQGGRPGQPGKPGGEQLQDGTPTTDNFAPQGA